MQPHRPRLIPAIFYTAVAVVFLSSGSAVADVWVFEPSAAIDQRIDDNYTIDPFFPDDVTATRVVGTLSLSREAPAASFTGLVRVDGLLTQSDTRDGDLESNQVAFLSSTFKRARSEYGIGLNFKRDTPSRDISADLTDISSVAADTGASVTQDQNVARQRWVLTPNWRYNLTRRTTLETALTYTTVKHDLPSEQDAILARWEEINPGVAPPDPITIDNVGRPFNVTDELDDFREVAIDVGVKTKLSPISTLSFFAGFSDYAADTEPDSTIIFAFEETTGDPNNPDIRRFPKREARSNTAKFRIGYDRALNPTLNVGVQVGIYTNTTDETDRLREDDDSFKNDTPESRAAALEELKTESSGYLANITATKSTGITRYSAKFGVDVLPSDIGSQVESLEAIGDLYREIGPLLDFSFRIRAYEPDAFNVEGDDEFSRRFLSMEPKLIWRFTRAWTAAGSYRYRRQKSQGGTRSGESNAILFSLKYTPPSAIRDAELAK